MVQALLYPGKPIYPGCSRYRVHSKHRDGMPAKAAIHAWVEAAPAISVAIMALGSGLLALSIGTLGSRQPLSGRG